MHNDAGEIRQEEREAILRLARHVARDAARAAGQKDGMDASENFVAMILRQAFAARDSELAREGSQRDIQR